jgi:hypothetical protein
MNNSINIADTTGIAEYKTTSTRIAPEIEQLYFELKDNDHIFQIGLKTLLNVYYLQLKRNKYQIFRYHGILKYVADTIYHYQN